MEKERSDNPLKSLLTGAVGGVFYVLTFHPVDTIKVRWQTMPLPLPGKSPKYLSLTDCFMKSMRHEGLFGLYSGVIAPLLTIVPTCSLCFAGYSLGNRLQEIYYGSRELTYSQSFVSGTIAGASCLALAVPTERIKCLLQVQHSSTKQNNKYKGFSDCVQKLYRTGGIRSIYRGFWVTAWRDVPMHGVWFLCYEYLMDTFKKPDQLVDLFSTAIAGGIAGMMYWIVGLPQDIIKSRVQTAPEGTYKHGMREVYRELMATEGFKGFYRGLIPVMLLSFPSNAACFVGVELTNVLLRTFNL